MTTDHELHLRHKGERTAMRHRHQEEREKLHKIHEDEHRKLDEQHHHERSGGTRRTDEQILEG